MPYFKPAFKNCELEACITCANGQMEAHLNRLLNEERQRQNSNISESDDETFAIDFNMTTVQDMLVSNEGEWIAARRHQLMRMWKGLKSLRTLHMPDEPGILDQASFGIFASFVYRWTNADSDDDSSSDDDGEPANIAVPMNQQETE